MINSNSSVAHKSVHQRLPLRQVQTTSNIPITFPNLRYPRADSIKSASAVPTLSSGNNSVPIPPLDPSPHDPSAVFIRWPFKEPITWAKLAANPNWFLDPKDFSTPGGRLYPTELEPPRGWGGPKNKRGQPVPDVDKEKPENRLRCTFCRRTYGGVNAKSMWRRHVFDKHHVAMRNRRDGDKVPRNKSKENKQSSFDKAEQAEDESPIFQEELEYPAGLGGDTAEGDWNLKSDHIQGFSPPQAPSIPQCEFTSPVRQRQANDYLLESESPYDPTRTPQFIHTRPIEPLHTALRPYAASPSFDGKQDFWFDPPQFELDPSLREIEPPGSSSPRSATASPTLPSWNLFHSFDDQKDSSLPSLIVDELGDLSGVSSQLSGTSSCDSSGVEFSVEFDLNQYLHLDAANGDKQITEEALLFPESHGLVGLGLTFAMPDDESSPRKRRNNDGVLVTDFKALEECEPPAKRRKTTSVG